MTTESPQQIVIDDVLEWRCGGCVVRPKLATFGLVGGVYVHVSGKRSYALNYVINVLESAVKAHCPACHTWRELYWDAEAETMRERAATGYLPLIGCRCEFERFAQDAASRRNGASHE